jgi:hypothetical protein
MADTDVAEEQLGNTGCLCRRRTASGLTGAGDRALAPTLLCG